MTTTIRPKERDQILVALRAGVVPRLGQHLIQVGRKIEVETLITDIDRIADGGTSFRLVIGDYGSGKSFFLSLISAVALQKRLIVASADLTPDRRLHSTSGQARSLYAELMRRLASQAKPGGGALKGLVEKFISTARTAADSSGTTTEEIIYERLLGLTDLVNGYDFARVIGCYWKGFQEDNEQLKADAIRWLRGEFTSKTDARQSLGVRSIVDDASVYDQLKLMACFVRQAGYGGLLVALDEMVNLYKLSNTQSRNSNYEQILRILNDSLQGNAEGIGFILGGTPDFLMNTSRGLYSYPALQSRLSENQFASEDVVDFSGPVVRLAGLSQEEFYVLLQRVHHVYAYGDESKYIIPEQAVEAFMQYCYSKIGETYFRTPRTTITSFIDFLSILEQNPSIQWNEVLGTIEVKRDRGGELETQVAAENDELVEFKLVD